MIHQNIKNTNHVSASWKMLIQFIVGMCFNISSQTEAVTKKNNIILELQIETCE